MDVYTLVSQGNAVNLVGAACLTALIYNHAITLDEEIDKMWPTRFSIAKFLFFTNRYPVEAILLFDCIAASRPYQSDNVCIFYLRWLTVASTISTTIVQGILILRVWVLYQRNKIAFYIALFFYIGGTAILIGITIKDYVGEQVLLNTSLSDLPGCYAKSVPSIIAGTWIGPLIVETVLFISVISRGFYWWRDGVSLPSIFMILARDSTIYFTAIFALLLANYLVFQFAPPALAGLLVTPAATTGCILGSHMMIHMRTMAEHTGSSINPHSHSIPVINTHEALRTRRGQCRNIEVGVQSLEFAEMHALPSPAKAFFQVDSRPLTPPSNLESAVPRDERRRSRVMFSL